MSFTQQANKIFNRAITDYHVKDDIETPIENPLMMAPLKTVCI